MAKGKKLVNVSESNLINNDLDSLVDCPACKGEKKDCKVCGGMGKISKRKAINFSKINN
jgi:DnaJ-class molecular chaperone